MPDPQAPSGSIRLGRVAGVPVYLDRTWLILGAFIAWTGWQAGRDLGTTTGIAYAGWLVLGILTAVLNDVITADEAKDFYSWARDGIAEAISLQDSSASDPAEQLMEYLREAIANGNAHLSGIDGAVPDGLARRGLGVGEEPLAHLVGCAWRQTLGDDEHRPIVRAQGPHLLADPRLRQPVRISAAHRVLVSPAQHRRWAR